MNLRQSPACFSKEMVFLHKNKLEQNRRGVVGGVQSETTQWLPLAMHQQYLFLSVKMPDFGCRTIYIWFASDTQRRFVMQHVQFDSCWRESGWSNNQTKILYAKKKIFFLIWSTQLSPTWIELDCVVWPSDVTYRVWIIHKWFCIQSPACFKQNTISVCAQQHTVCCTT